MESGAVKIEKVKCIENWSMLKSQVREIFILYEVLISWMVQNQGINLLSL